MGDPKVTNGQVDSAHYGPAGDTARAIASYCEGEARSNVYKAAFESLSALQARLAAVEAEREAAREALERLIEACDRGRQVSKPGAGVSGMTIEAQTRAMCINGVDAWTVEEAREIATSIRTKEQPHG